MVSSSDIATLMEQAKKVIATLDKLGVILADERINNQNAEGYLAKPIVSDLPIDSLCNYRVKESQTANSFSENNTTLSAYQVFDINPDPNSGLNVVPGVENDVDGTQTREICWKNEVNEEVKLLYAHDVLDEIPLPEFIREMAKSVKFEKETMVSSAYQVFDEFSEPILSLFDEVLQDDPLEVGAYNLFDEMPEPIFGSHQVQMEVVLNSDILDNKIEGKITESHHVPGTKNSHLNFLNVDLVPRILKWESHCYLIEEPKGFNKTRLLHFTQEDVHDEKMAHNGSLECDHTLVSHIVYNSQDVNMWYVWQLLVELGALDDLNFTGLVIIGASIGYVPTLPSLPFSGCKISDETPHNVDDFYNELLYCARPRYQVSIKPFISDETYPINLVKNVVCPLILNDKNWFMETNLLMILGLEVNNTRMFALENGQRTFLSFKEVHSWGFDPVVGRSHMKLTVCDLDCIPCLDPNPDLEVERMINEGYIWELVDLFCFDPGGLWAYDLWADDDGLLHEVSLLSDNSYFRLGVYGVAFLAGNVVLPMGIKVFIFIPTLEDKGDLTREEMRLVRLSYIPWDYEKIELWHSPVKIKDEFNGEENYSGNQAPPRLDILMNLQVGFMYRRFRSDQTTGFFCFSLPCFMACGMDQECDKEQEALITLEQPATQKVDKLVSVMESEKSQGSVLKKLLMGIYGRMGYLGVIDAKYDVAISTACPGLDYILIEIAEAVQKCVDLLREKNVGVVTFMILEKRERLHNFDLVQRGFLGYTSFHSNSIKLKLCSCFITQAISVSLLTLLQWFHYDEHQPFMVWVFDPGGYDIEPTMRKRPQVYAYGVKRRKFRRREDYQSYVFDPGGSLVLQGYKSVLLCVMEEVLFFILEDKDNFKGPVMIQSEIFVRASLVNLAFISYCSRHLGLFKLY